MPTLPFRSSQQTVSRGLKKRKEGRGGGSNQRMDSKLRPSKKRGRCDVGENVCDISELKPSPFLYTVAFPRFLDGACGKIPDRKKREKKREQYKKRKRKLSVRSTTRVRIAQKEISRPRVRPSLGSAQRRPLETAEHVRRRGGSGGDSTEDERGMN